MRSNNGYKQPKTLISNKAKKLDILLKILLPMIYNSLQGMVLLHKTKWYFDNLTLSTCIIVLTYLKPGA